MLRIEGHYPDDLADWIREESIKRGMNNRKFLCHIAQAYRERSSQEGQKPRKPRTKRQQLIESVRQNNSLIRSAVSLGIHLDEIREWRKDPAFLAEIEGAQAYWIEGLQEDMRKIGVGEKSGDANALSRLLNAHHPSFGRAKTEMILRVIDPLVRDLVRDLQREIGDEAAGAIQKVLDRHEVRKRKRLSLVG